MTRAARWPLLVGALLFCLGVGILFARGLASLVSMDWLVSRLGHDYLVVALVGIVALGLALLVVLARTLDGFDGADPPSTESVPAGRPAGEEIDRVIERGLDPAEHLTGGQRTAVRARLRRTAVETVMRVDGCSSAAATASVSAGEWTDDGTAAAFLADDGAGEFGRRLRDALPGGSRFQRRTARAVTAILERDQGADGR
jgi:hypothetical protein